MNGETVGGYQSSPSSTKKNQSITFKWDLAFTPFFETFSIICYSVYFKTNNNI